MSGTKGQWESQDSHLLLPRSLANPVSRFLHPFIRHSALKLETVQLPLCMGYQHALIVAGLFPGWVGAFLRCTAGALTVTRKLVEDVFPTWGVPSTIPVVEVPSARTKSQEP